MTKKQTTLHQRAQYFQNNIHIKRHDKKLHCNVVHKEKGVKLDMELPYEHVPKSIDIRR